MTFLWSILELEEGREVVGILLLLGHGIFLQHQQRQQSSSKDSQQQINGNAQPASHAAQRRSQLAVMLALGCIGLAVYAWVYYQPAMNAKEKVEHCSGQFHPSLPTNGQEL